MSLSFCWGPTDTAFTVSSMISPAKKRMRSTKCVACSTMGPPAKDRSHLDVSAALHRLLAVHRDAVRNVLVVANCISHVDANGAAAVVCISACDMQTCRQHPKLCMPGIRQLHKWSVLTHAVSIASRHQAHGHNQDFLRASAETLDTVLGFEMEASDVHAYQSFFLMSE